MGSTVRRDYRMMGIVAAAQDTLSIASTPVGFIEVAGSVHLQEQSLGVGYNHQF
ncbi:MAG: hypothetical protein QM718_05840 [Steroidobacteraceae bacterium]